MEKRDIPFLSATELSDLIAGKEISPVEATEAYLERIEQVDKQLNSYITVTADGALRSAREAERAIAQGHYRGPMHGVPVAIKDQIFTKGVRTTGGSRILADFVPEEDATVAAKLNQAGAVLLGKLNMSEFAMAEIYDHPHGTPRNPWDPARNPGTSSSGSGAATAAFLCATSLGEDTGGSIRSPANWCGLVGLRPTWGRVSRYGVMGAVWSMDTAGPISRTVEDCALTLQTIAGHDPKDPFTQNVPVPDYRRSLSGDMRGLKVGVLKERMETGLLDPEYREAVLKATAVLGELGGVVEEVSIPLTDHSGAISWGIIATEWSALYGIRSWVAFKTWTTTTASASFREACSLPRAITRRRSSAAWYASKCWLRWRSSTCWCCPRGPSPQRRWSPSRDSRPGSAPWPLHWAV